MPALLRWRKRIHVATRQQVQGVSPGIHDFDQSGCEWICARQWMWRRCSVPEPKNRPFCIRLYIKNP